MFVVEVQTAGKDDRASVAEDFSAKFSTSKWAKELVTFSAYSQKSEGLFLLESYWPVCVWGRGCLCLCVWTITSELNAFNLDVWLVGSS